MIHSVKRWWARWTLPLRVRASTERTGAGTDTNAGKNGAACSAVREAGADVTPPWVAWPGQVSFTQGWPEVWWRDTWRPYWTGLTPEQRIVYVIKWEAPDYWPAALLNAEGLAWLDRLGYRTPVTEEKPPWLGCRHRRSLKQGMSKSWLDLFWYPYWHELNDTERIAYAIKWDAPDDWLQTLFDAEQLAQIEKRKEQAD